MEASLDGAKVDSASCGFRIMKFSLSHGIFGPIDVVAVGDLVDGKHVQGFAAEHTK